MSSEPARREQTQVRLAMIIAALMMAHQVAGKAARDGIFLSQFNTSALPGMITAAAITAVVASIVRGRRLVRSGPFRITAMSFAASGVLQAAEWMLLGYYPRAAACAIYLHIVAFGAVLLSGFWSVMNESFDPHSARHSFGRISGMGTLGGLCGGVLAERVVAWFSAPAVILLLAAMHLLCAVVLWRAFPGPVISERTVRPSSDAGIADVAHRYPFLLTLAGLVLAASAGTALLDFVFKVQAAQTMGRGPGLLRFFSLYYTATSLLIFLVQTFLTRVLMQHVGLAACAGALPAAIAAGSLASLFIPGFQFLSGIRGLEILTRGSVYRSAYELFFTPVAASDKRAAKPIMDVGVDRLGDAVGAGCVSLLLVMSPGGFRWILVTAALIAGVAFVLAIRLQKGYLKALEKSLESRAHDVDPALAEGAFTRSLLLQSVVMEGPVAVPGAPGAKADRTTAPAVSGDLFVQLAGNLRSGDPARAIQTIDKLGPGDWELAPLLIDLLAWPPAMHPARDALRRMGPKITGMLIDVLLDTDADFTIRRRVPKVLAFVPSQRSVDGLFAALEDHRFEVRFYSGRALFLLLRDNPEFSLAPERIWAIINRELALQKSVWQSHRLLDSRESQDSDWFFDDELKDRADRNLEHLFTLLGLLLPESAVRIAFRALHTEDRELKGTAFEYLESATPPGTRRPLLQLLEADAESRVHQPAANEALAKLLKSRVAVNERLDTDLSPTETLP